MAVAEVCCVKGEGTRTVLLSVLDLNIFKSPCLARPERTSFIACRKCKALTSLLGGLNI
jgi:hypothetical protein